MNNSPLHGTILFAHGSRDPLWRKPIEAVALRITEMAPQVQVRCAYLELTAPDLTTSADELIALGVSHLTVLPLFLGVGKHAREDLPLIIEEIRAAHPSLRLELLPTAGESPQLTALMADIALA